MPGSFESSNTSFDTGSLIGALLRQLDRAQLAAKERARFLDDRIGLDLFARDALALAGLALFARGEALGRASGAGGRAGGDHHLHGPAEVLGGGFGDGVAAALGEREVHV